MANRLSNTNAKQLARLRMMRGGRVRRLSLASLAIVVAWPQTAQRHGAGEGEDNEGKTPWSHRVN